MKISWEQGTSESDQTRDPVPAGTYAASVHSAELIDSFRGGKTAKVILSIDKGLHAGRWIWEYFDVGDLKPERAAMARRRLQILARCAGVSGRDYDLAELVGIKVEIQTRVVETKRGLQGKVSRFNPLPTIVAAANQFDETSPISATNLPF